MREGKAEAASGGEGGGEGGRRRPAQPTGGNSKKVTKSESSFKALKRKGKEDKDEDEEFPRNITSLLEQKQRDAGEDSTSKVESPTLSRDTEPYPEPSIRRTGWLKALIGQHKPGTPAPLANTSAAKGLRTVDLPLEDPEGALPWDPPNDDILQSFRTVQLDTLQAGFLPHEHKDALDDSSSSYIFSEMFKISSQDFEFPPCHVGSAISETGHRVIALPTVHRIRMNMDPPLPAAVMLYDPVLAFVALGAFDKYLRTRDTPCEYFTPSRTADALMRGYRFTPSVIMPLIRITESCGDSRSGHKTENHGLYEISANHVDTNLPNTRYRLTDEDISITEPFLWACF
ncbi:hypothetical protein TI39_contig491g00004 [Zymoseptoria brevis]|uniref:Uncharacterized protein n=1 Tax=Zymoseptoria brevis TaxID=1047168 RepID=A0A0F4GJK9_9PEZI|nr:hypothetical protein TI39_contig491g00004 [Zymoseptoria brevis]